MALLTMTKSFLTYVQRSIMCSVFCLKNVLEKVVEAEMGGDYYQM